jgi:hypothetical protein
MDVKLSVDSDFELGREESWSVASSFVEGVCEENVHPCGRTRLRRSTVMYEVKSDQVVVVSSSGGGKTVK